MHNAMFWLSLSSCRTEIISVLSNMIQTFIPTVKINPITFIFLTFYEKQKRD